MSKVIAKQTQRAYQICTRCVMDTTDPEITFGANGECKFCEFFDAHYRGQFGSAPDKLNAIVDAMKAAGRGKAYDCVIGVSGGIDSSYIAFLVKSLGLRALAVHVDNGWNSELAVANIERLLNRLGIDLYTEVLDWEEFRDIQLSFLKAATPDGEVATDHAIVAIVQRTALQQRIRYVISGSNLATEGALPSAWAYGHRDWRYIRAIHKRFGTRPLATFPHFSYPRMLAVGAVGLQRVVRLLNFVDYDKVRAKQTLTDDFGWRDYGGKHYESVYTRFYQGSILPKQFGIDKRKAHLSSLIWSEQTTRAQALEELTRPPLDAEVERQDEVFVAKKLGLSLSELRALVSAPPKSHHDYPYSRFAAGEGPVYRALQLVYRAVRDRKQRGTVSF